MNTDNLYGNVTFVNSAAAVIRGVLPSNTAKRLARLAGIPLATARTWIYVELSRSRRRELAMQLLDEMDAQDVARGAIRRRLAEWAGELEFGKQCEFNFEASRVDGAWVAQSVRTEAVVTKRARG